jgi:predicted AlkP superfamily phosphohydrolase/phosphomutase
MEKQAYINSYCILSLHDAYGTEKLLIDEDFLSVQKNLDYLRELMRLHKRILRYISKKCPKFTKIYLEKELRNYMKKNNVQILVYYLANEIRKIEVKQGDTCLIRIKQRNVFFPEDLESEELFND